MDLNQYIFREYDIRGKVSDDFPPEVVEALGKGFGTYIKRGGGQEIALSGDIRLTTPDLMEQFKTGVLSTGVDVINIGILPTPANYYSMFSRSPGRSPGLSQGQKDWGLGKNKLLAA